MGKCQHVNLESLLIIRILTEGWRDITMSATNNVKWKLEDDVNDYVKNKLESLGLKKLKDYNVESSMSDYMKEALKGSAVTVK